jgi:outer membrane protein OmpA-like peptidoglycan-associated protein
MKIHNTITVLGLFALAILLNSCSSAGVNKTGSEYMPDMYHSIAYEANTYTDYRYNTWDDQSAVRRKALSMPHLPVAGTIPRGYEGVMSAKTDAEREAVTRMMYGEKYTNTKSIPMNGDVPYYYGNTEEERTRAMNEIQMNPFPITAKGLEDGKQLYNINCAICHGEKADGNGYLVSEENKNAKYPAQPTNLLTDELIDASNGRYYHAIYYGRNLMGSYKDKLSFEERWQVIHYLRNMQAAARKLEYNNLSNTLNKTSVIGGPDMRHDAFAKAVVAAVSAPRDTTGGAKPVSIKLENVFFETGSAKLDPKSREELLKLVYIMNRFPDLKIELGGHTDNVGDPSSNLALSQSRAESVKGFLLENGVGAARLKAQGYGQDRPVATNDTLEGRSQNRRTEFTIL